MCAPCGHPSGALIRILGAGDLPPVHRRARAPYRRGHARATSAAGSVHPACIVCMPPRGRRALSARRREAASRTQAKRRTRHQRLRRVRAAIRRGVAACQNGGPHMRGVTWSDVAHHGSCPFAPTRPRQRATTVSQPAGRGIAHSIPRVLLLLFPALGHAFPVSIVASIRRCHRRDRGSIPRQEAFWEFPLAGR